MTYRSGDIVLVPFPFTNLSSSKRRPAVLLRALEEFDDWLCLPVTTQGSHPASAPLAAADFHGEELPHASWVRCNRPTVLNESLMLGCIAALRAESLLGLMSRLCADTGCHAPVLMEPPAPLYRAS